ncbi:Putative intracellular protease/amidase [Elusimicrobium minutum Pei191]|uniref:Putative intracellular protease/amidase n=1 Tax=Elusimicrobium minutum (strain Pei191) TaxID=445932 RepID=B2KCZ1_ELUMP|nr:DJ-1 family glyoxalase III [Elusimicrobium minutum]ACC98387.1 Putative intracellular protease/amidase [Elusimicrobium minutum Pei191]
MSKVALFIIDGFEEAEAVVTADLLRRADVGLKIVSLSDKKEVLGKHNITVTADVLFNEVKNDIFDMLVIPGGTIKYIEHKGLLELVKKQHAAKRNLAAICAAPAVFGTAGILEGYKATIYTGMRVYLGPGAVYEEEPVVTDRHITTSRGPGTSMAFGVRLIEILKGKDVADKIKEDFLLK